MADILNPKNLGKSIVNNAVKRTVGSALKDTNDVLDALLGVKDTDKVSTICFPHDIRTDANSTYMVIYIMDNQNNQLSFSNSIFNSKVDTSSYEIKAIAYAKEYAKQELKNLERAARDVIKQAKDSVIEDVVDFFSTPSETQKTKEAQGKTAAEKVANAEQQISKIKQAWNWTNEWLIPHRVKSPDQKIREELDPANNPGKGYVLKKAIALQLPNSPLTYKNDYGWEAADTKTIEMIKKLGSAIYNYGSGLFTGDEAEKKKLYQSGANDFKTMWPDAQRAIGDAVTGGSYSAYENSKTQQWRNPLVVFNYKTPDPRTFSYSFSFAPRNKEELYDIYNIIALLRFYAAPILRGNTPVDDGKVMTEGTNTAGWWVNFPAKFSVKFYTGGYENQWLHKSITLGLTSISETLTGENGDLAFFENYFDTGSGNPPRLIELTLNFTELGIIDRHAINAGY